MSHDVRKRFKGISEKTYEKDSMQSPKSSRSILNNMTSSIVTSLQLEYTRNIEADLYNYSKTGLRKKLSIIS